MTDVPDAAYVAALSELPGMGPRRLRLLLAHYGPAGAYDAVAHPRQLHPAIRAGIPADLVERWSRSVAAEVPAQSWQRCLDAGIDVVIRGAPGYPQALVHDPDPPPALFVRGDLTVLAARRVGIVGTRNPTRSGLWFAERLGADLADAGVTVLSGLARGIDGAAHRGAVGAGGRAAAVVGSGPDVVYPTCHAELWTAICRRGLLVSEWPPGTPPESFRFPLRNRILAALCEVVVVVESRERGGSLITAKHAIDRSVSVMAVPGSPHHRSSVGTNRLIADGAAPVTDATDVLVALGLDSRRRGDVAYDPRPRPTGLAWDVLTLCRREARTLDDVVMALDVPVADAAMALARLEVEGWLVASGGWFEAVDRWSEPAGHRGPSWSGAS